MRRLRLTTHLPLDGTRIGLTVWFGSVEHGWYGKPVNPRRWHHTWRVTSETASPPVSANGNAL